jgi:hypothetical protein
MSCFLCCSSFRRGVLCGFQVDLPAAVAVLTGVAPASDGNGAGGTCVARAAAALAVLGCASVGVRLGGVCRVVHELPPPPKGAPASSFSGQGVGSVGVVVALKPWAAEATVVFDAAAVGGVPLHCLAPAWPPQDASEPSAGQDKAPGADASAEDGGGGDEEGNAEEDAALSALALSAAELGANAAVGSELLRRAPSALDALAAAVLALSGGVRDANGTSENEFGISSSSSSGDDEDAEVASPAGLLLAALAADALAAVAASASAPSLAYRSDDAAAARAAQSALPAAALPLAVLARAAAQPCVPDGMPRGSAASHGRLAFELSQRLYEAAALQPLFEPLLGEADHSSAQGVPEELAESHRRRPLREAHAVLWVGDSAYAAAVAKDAAEGTSNSGQPAAAVAAAAGAPNSSASSSGGGSSSAAIFFAAVSGAALLPEGHASAVGVWACGPAFAATAESQEGLHFSSLLPEALRRPGLGLRVPPTMVSA